MFSFPRRRAVARLAVGLVALGVPLLGASAAQAAMGTATTLQTVNRPDLTSASATSPTNVRFCFDKVLGIGGALNPANFQIGDYHFDGYDNFPPSNLLGGTTIASATNNQCVDVGFGLNGNEPDLSQYTYGFVLGGQVQGGAAPGNALNNPDSVPLTSSLSNNGTRGLSAGPDLQTVQTNTGGTTNTIEYTFDQIVSNQVTLAPAAFFFEDGTGAEHNGVAILGVNGNKVTVGFGTPVVPCPGACNDVGSAIRAGEHAVGSAPPATAGFLNNWSCTVAGGPCGPLGATPGSTSANSGGNRGRPISSNFVVPVQGTGGQTSRPDVTGASVLGSSITVTYDQAVDLAATVTPGAPTAALTACNAIAADGSRIHPTAEIVSGNGQQVTLSFTTGVTSNNGFPSEQIVGFVDTGGCTRIPPGTPAAGTPSAEGSAVTGGNIGAKALGYTTGPEAILATLDRPNDTATVVLDQPVTNVSNAGGAPQPNAPRFHLVLGGNGDNAFPPAAVTCSTVQIGGFDRGGCLLTFGAGQVPDAGTVGIRMDAAAVATRSACGDAQCSTDQTAPLGAGAPGLLPQYNVIQVFAAA